MLMHQHLNASKVMHQSNKCCCFVLFFNYLFLSQKEESMATDSPLESVSSSHSRVCSFWHLCSDFRLELQFNL